MSSENDWREYAQEERWVDPDPKVPGKIDDNKNISLTLRGEKNNERGVNVTVQ